MTKKVNLLNIDNLNNSMPTYLSEDSVKEYLGIKDVKPRELETIKRLNQFLKAGDFNYHMFENYYLGYIIPQIGKEFDLLRFGQETILNIELKSARVSDEKILEQLEKNHYYLKVLNKETYYFTFLTDGATDILFKYDIDSNTMQEVDRSSLVEIINGLRDDEKNSIENLFVPSDYLISPFNTTEKFIQGEYFLTEQQKLIKKSFIEKIEEGSQNIFSISGAAGTGKTLLTYDIAKELINGGKSVAIIHCAQLNNGQILLNNQAGWNLLSVKYYATALSTSNILIIDEAHRLTPYQLDQILTHKDKCIIFSHDTNQKLNTRGNYDLTKVVVDKIINSSGTFHKELSKKIRHNKNLASFIIKFFNLSIIGFDNLQKDDYSAVSLYYAADNQDAMNHVAYLKYLGWEHIYLTTSTRETEPLDNIRFGSTNSAHQSIGQEYDNVVVVIDENFYYPPTQKLSYRSSYYYNPLETLFQAVTRTRKNLTFVIINNQEVYQNCLKIISRNI